MLFLAHVTMFFLFKDLSVAFTDGVSWVDSSALSVSCSGANWSVENRFLTTLLSQKFSDSTLAYSEYIINFGITDDDDKAYFIRGIDELALESLGLPMLPDDTAFSSQEIDKQKVLLRIPIIKVEEGGFSSSNFVEYQISLTPYPTNLPPLDVLDIYSDTIFVNKNVLKSIVENMYQISWDSFIERYDGGESFGIEAINRMFVYVDKLSMDMQ